MYTPILLVSSLISFLSIRQVRKDPLLANGFTVVYIIWNLPLFLSVVFPFTFPFQDISNYPFVLLIISIIHIILGGGIIAFKNYRKKYIQKEVNVIGSSPPYIFFLAAYASPFILSVDNFIFKGVSLSSNLEQNREAVTSESTPLGLIAVVCAGICLYLLSWAFTFDGKKIRVHPSCLLPYVLTLIVITLGGNRQFLLLGIMFLLFNFIKILKPKIKRTLKWLVNLTIIFVPLSLAFQFARQTKLEDKQTEFITTILKISIIDNHPLKQIFTFNETILSASLYIYTYFGTQYDTISATAKTIHEFSPFASLTLPVLYRRWAVGLNLPSQNDVMETLQNQLASEYGIFPKIWTTMFGSIYVEGGLLYLCFFCLILCYVHSVLVNNYLKNTALGDINLIIFYVFMIFGIITIGTYEVPFFFLMLAAFLNSKFNLKVFKKYYW